MNPLRKQNVVLLGVFLAGAVLSVPCAFADDEDEAVNRDAAEIVTGLPASTRALDSQDCANPEFDRKMDQILNNLVVNKKQVPTAAVTLGSANEIRYQKSVSGSGQATSKDTLYDLASVTKAVATAPSIMVLKDQGKLKLTDQVGTLLPQFKGSRVGNLTVEQLLQHHTGLCDTLPYTPASREYYLNKQTGKQHRDASNKAEFMAQIKNKGYSCHRTGDFTYSDLGYILLGEIVEKRSGMPLDQFARKYLFEPMGMKNTMYNPPAGSSCARTAKTVRAPCQPFDETAFFQLHGVGGHAGLFSTSADLSRFAQMVLNNGVSNGKRILSEDSIKKLSTDNMQTQRIHHGLGFDIDSASSTAARGNFPQDTSFGHTGYNGTSFWIDRSTSSFTIILTNKVYSGNGNVTPLRRDVANAHYGWLTSNRLQAGCSVSYDGNRRKPAPISSIYSAATTGPASAVRGQ